MMPSFIRIFFVLLLSFSSFAASDFPDDFDSPIPFQELMRTPRFPQREMKPKFKNEENEIVGGQSQRTYYIQTEEEREKYRIHFDDGLAYDHAGNLLNSDGIFRMKIVMDSAGNFYGGAVRVPPGYDYKHSSYLAHEAVTDAFEVDVLNGQILNLYNYSGHFAPAIDLKRYSLSELKNRGVDISKIKTDEYWWAKNPSIGGPPIEGPPKNGVEFLQAHPLQSTPGEIRGFTPAQDFWTSASNWMKLDVRDFPNKREFTEDLLKQKTWPDQFVKQIPDILKVSDLTTANQIDLALSKQIQQGSLTVSQLRQNGIAVPQDILKERQFLLRSIRRKLKDEGLCP